VADIINLCIIWAGSALSILNLNAMRHGVRRLGKIARTLGPFGYLAVLAACLALILVDLATGHYSFSVSDISIHTNYGKAGVTLQLIIAADNFLNGNDPPKRRRRKRIKNSLLKLVPVKSH
jgi:hypothetical protein